MKMTLRTTNCKEKLLNKWWGYRTMKELEKRKKRLAEVKEKMDDLEREVKIKLSGAGGK